MRVVDVPRVFGVVLAGAVAFLCGCTSLSGVGGETQYACPAPSGVQCGSVTANYLQSIRGDLLGQPPTARVNLEARPVRTAQVTAARIANANPDSGGPLYSPPRILKLWIAPWEDRDGVLHDAAFVFVPIDRGRWLLDPARPALRLESRAIRPPRSDAALATASIDPAGPGSAPPHPTSPAADKDGDDH